MKFLLILSLICSIFSESMTPYEIDYYSCMEIDYPNKECWSAKLESSEYECCLVRFYSQDNQLLGSNCQMDLKGFNKIANDPKLMAIYREMNGFQYAMENSFGEEEESFIYKYKCEKNEYQVDSSFLYFSESEKTILKSKDHCLYHQYHYDMNKPVDATEDQCNNGKLLQSTEKEGIQCALYDISVGNKNAKTCLLFNNDLSTKSLDDLTLKSIKEIVYILSGEDSPFTIKISWDGQSGVYDSKTKEFTKNKSEFIKISKYFLLFLLSLI